MSFWSSFPDTYRKNRASWVFQRISRFWFTDKVIEHPETCKCPGCFLGVLQPELRL